MACDTRMVACFPSSDVLEITDLLGSRLLHACSAGWLPSGSFRPVATLGNKDGAISAMAECCLLLLARWRATWAYTDTLYAQKNIVDINIY